MGIRERTDPLDIESNGRYAHDMAFILVDRDFQSDRQMERRRRRDPRKAGRWIPNSMTKPKNELYAASARNSAKPKPPQTDGRRTRVDGLAAAAGSACRSSWASWRGSSPALVLILVGLMRRPALHIQLPEGVSLSFLPAVHAALNALVAIMLVGALAAVLTGTIALHRGFILAAMGSVGSVPAELRRLSFHRRRKRNTVMPISMARSIRAERAGGRRFAAHYLVLLVTHIVLAGISLPFILFTFIAGWTNRFASPPQACALGVSALAVCRHHRAGLLLDAAAVLSVAFQVMAWPFGKAQRVDPYQHGSTAQGLFRAASTRALGVQHDLRRPRPGGVAGTFRLGAFSVCAGAQT